jgi:hypothetical protein
MINNLHIARAALTPLRAANSNNAYLKEPAPKKRQAENSI